MTDRFLSCDWGTTNFRLRLVSIPDLKVLCEDANDKGVSEIYRAWKQQDEDDTEKRKEFYLEVIKTAISRLEQEERCGSLDGLPVVVSGMASSTIGMMDIPYQSLPFSIDGSGLKVETIEANEDFDHRLIIISGVKCEDDVMRGEETQAVGAITDEMIAFEGRQLLIHPGTHSKHIIIEKGQVTGFNTYMTGEFFKILTTTGLLCNSVEKPGDGEDSMTHFEQGVKDALNTTLLNAAFKVRTNDIFQRMSKTENYAYLSGVLIGSELQEIDADNNKVYLACGGTLFKHYQAAINALGLQDKVTSFDPQAMDESVVRGQYKILNKQLNM